jgi:hypothetical protein
MPKKTAENKLNFAKVLLQIESAPVKCGETSVGSPHFVRADVDQLATVFVLRQVCFQDAAESRGIAISATISPQLLGNEKAKACVCGGSTSSD